MNHLISKEELAREVKEAFRTRKDELRPYKKSLVILCTDLAVWDPELRDYYDGAIEHLSELKDPPLLFQLCLDRARVMVKIAGKLHITFEELAIVMRCPVEDVRLMAEDPAYDFVVTPVGQIRSNQRLIDFLKPYLINMLAE